MLTRKAHAAQMLLLNGSNGVISHLFHRCFLSFEPRHQQNCLESPCLLHAVRGPLPWVPDKQPPHQTSGPLQVCVSEYKRPAKLLPHVHYLLSLASGIMCMAKTHRSTINILILLFIVYLSIMHYWIIFHRHESLVALWLSDNAQNRSICK